MNLEDLMDRVLGFMPLRTVFLTAAGTFLLSITLQFTQRWLKKVTLLPWMKEENQRNRQKILQGTEKLPEDHES